MAKKKLDFAASYRELEELSAWFERGEPDLDVGMEKFARGQELIKALQERLQEAEQTIQQIRVTSDRRASAASSDEE